MGVELEIFQPRHGQRFVAPALVRLRGRIAADPEGTGGAAPLHLKWYSSLQAGASDGPEGEVEGAEDAPINGSEDDPRDFTRRLRIGTHVLTLSAKDVPGDSPDDLAEVTRAGLVGGADDDPCVVTVLDAQILELEAGVGGLPPVLSGTVTLAALAPARWGADVTADGDNEPVYVPDPDYHQHNTVGYRWELVADSAQEPALRWEADVDDLQFDLDDPGESLREGPPRVRLQRTLPEDLSSGPYTLVLRVVDVTDPDDEHSQDTRQVQVG